MNFKNTLLNGLKIGKAIAPNKLGDQTVISEMIHANIHSELLKKGEVVIPESVLEKQVREFLAKDDMGVTIDALACKEDHIALTVTVDKLGVSLSSAAKLTIRDAGIGKDRQIVSFHVAPGKVTGNNMLGRLSEKMIGIPVLKRIVDMIVRTIIEYIFKSDGPRWLITDHVTYSLEDSQLIVDVSRIGQIEKLSRPLPGIEESVLDFISFKAVHQSGGISIIPEISDKGKMMKSVFVSQFRHFTRRKDNPQITE